jgi:hypothetical protein
VAVQAAPLLVPAPCLDCADVRLCPGWLAVLVCVPFALQLLGDAKDSVEKLKAKVFEMLHI